MNKISKQSICSKIKKDFIEVSKDTLIKKEEGLTDFTKFVLLILIKFKNKDSGLSFPSLDTISNLMSKKDGKSISFQNVSEAIKRLEETKHIEIEKRETKRKGFSGNNYKILYSVNDEVYEKVPQTLLINKNFTWQERFFMMKFYTSVLLNTNKVNLIGEELAVQIGISSQTLKSKMAFLETNGIVVKTKTGYEVDLHLLLSIGDEPISEIVEENQNLKEENKSLKKELRKLKELIEVEQEVGVDEEENEDINGVMSATIKRPTYKNKLTNGTE